MADKRKSLVAVVADAVLRNWGYKLLSLAITLGAWLYVQAGQTTETKLRGMVDWRLPPNLATTEPLPTSVMVTVRGSRTAIRRAERAEVMIRADLSDANLGEYRVDFASLEVSGLPTGVTIVGFSPSTVRFALDETSTKKVRVNPVTVGDPGDGYAVVSTALDPEVVLVEGPRSAIRDVRAVATKPIDVTDLVADATVPVELDLPWGLLARGTLHAQIDVEPVREDRVFGGVPVVVLGSNGWEPAVSEAEVTLQGDVDALKTIDRRTLAIVVSLPENPGKAHYEASLDATDGARVSIHHPDVDGVRAVAMMPPTIGVTRR